MARPIHVLAVDDTPANLMALDAALGDTCAVVPAASGHEAIAILESRSDIDLILMDVQMPVLDGFETAAFIKRMESSREIPIVFVTAVFRDDPWARRGYEAGGIDYFCKPFDLELLRTKVGIYGGLKQRADFLRERERQLRLAEEMLAAARSLSTSFERAATGVILTDADGSVRSMNEEVFRLFRFTKETGCETDDEAGERAGNSRFITYQLAAVTGRVDRSHPFHQALLKIRCGDGSERTVLCSASLLQDSNAGDAGVAIVVHDVTQAMRIEGDLARNVAELEGLAK